MEGAGGNIAERVIAIVARNDFTRTRLAVLSQSNLGADRQGSLLVSYCTGNHAGGLFVGLGRRGRRCRRLSLGSRRILRLHGRRLAGLGCCNRGQSADYPCDYEYDQSSSAEDRSPSSTQNSPSGTFSIRE